MAKKVSARKTIFKIACATGGAVLASGVGLPWLGAMAGACLPEVLEGSLGFLVSAIKDDTEKKKVLEELLKKPIEQLASLGIEFTGGRIDDFFKSHFEAKESELNFDLPRAVVKVWKEAVNKMLRAERDTSTLGLNRDDSFEKGRKELLKFWREKLRKAQSDNDSLKEFFGEKPDYFLDVENGKGSFIDALPDQKQVENFFWQRIEDSFTNWAKNEGKFPKNWTNSIHQSLKDELKQNLFHNFSSALKEELKNSENERAWKSFEFAASLQIVSMLKSLASNIDQIKDDTSNIKKDLTILKNILQLNNNKIEDHFNKLEDAIKEILTSNDFIKGFLMSFRNDVSNKLLEIAQTTRRTDETTQRTEGRIAEIGKDISKTKHYAKQSAKNSEKSLNRLDDALLSISSIEKIVIANNFIDAAVSKSKPLEMLQIEIEILSNQIIATLQNALEKIPELDNILTKAELLEFLGLLYYYRQDFDKSITHHNDASQKFEAIDKYTRGIINQFGVGNSLLNNGDHKEAIKKYKNSIQLLEKGLR